MTPQDIKDELIRLGWSKIPYGATIETKNIYFRYDTEGNDLTIRYDGQWIYIESPTIERIKALIYGMTGKHIDNL